MNRNLNRRTAAAIAVAAALLVCAALFVRRPVPPGGSGAPARHVIFISLDTTRPDFIGAYGNPWIRTPNIDRLASESILLTDCTTVVPTTLASHTSMMTGTYAHTHGVPRNGFLVPDENVMLPEILKEAGFRTAGFAGAYPISARFNFPQGFDHFDEDFDLNHDLMNEGADERRADAVVQRACEWLENNRDADRIFAFLHFFDPHGPYEPPAPWDSAYGAPGEPLHAEPCRPEDPAFSLPAGSREKIRAYAGEISYMDEQIGVLLKRLDEIGLLKDSILIMTSDHGETHHEHDPPFDHGLRTYDDTIRNVGIIRLPGGRNGGKAITGPTMTIDLAPTLLSWLGLPAPERTEGIALDLDNPERPQLVRPQFCEASQPWEEVEIPDGWYNRFKARCVRFGGFKYITTPFERTEELYDLSSDPCEQANLLETPDRRTSVTRAELAARLEEWSASAVPLGSEFVNEDQEEVMRRLRGLGYLGGP